LHPKHDATAPSSTLRFGPSFCGAHSPTIFCDANAAEAALVSSPQSPSETSSSNFLLHEAVDPNVALARKILHFGPTVANLDLTLLPSCKDDACEA